MKKVLTIMLMLSLFTGVANSASKQTEERKERKALFTTKKESKRDLEKQRDSLRLVVKELQNRLDSIQYSGYISISDTLSIGDTINPGFMELFGEETDLFDTVAISTDSLLSMWYNKRELSIYEFHPDDIDSIPLTSNIPDSVYIKRLQKMNSFIALPYNQSIRNHIIYYTEKMPDKMETILGLSNYYLPIFEEILDSYGLPLELKAMAIIESALNTTAVSRANAKGMWQFMYSTAKRYDLHINSYVDERFDPIASAHAAAKYLRDSYLIFGDWALAIASYNCGAGNVNKAIRRSGGAKDFWGIYPYLPRETRGYVPSFIAALYTLNYYKEHNLYPKQIPMPPHVDTLKINKMLHFEQIMHYTGITKEELKNFNPQYLHEIIPGTEREYILRLPYQYTAKFIDNEAEIYKYKDSVYFNAGAMKKIQAGATAEATRIVHKVRKGETLSHIAQKYRVSVNNIKRWNNCGTKIRIGQRLVIYTNNKGPAKSSSSTAKPKTSTSGNYVYYTVRKGDTLWDIAKMFPGVTMNDIMKLNNLNRNSRIYPGTKLKIKKAN
ncbi:MAG: LysM peptidoglycan-binding domain-containing protein [Bacteroidales bacterium]|nr:LysM peptidoglycan-binding domain-containing protein [Bacteroidales bacterium]